MISAERLDAARPQGGSRAAAGSANGSANGSAYVSAYDIADALALPRPTAQQRAVIEAPLAPALVVAGAGSGKTETMANRVLWLLANGHVRAGEILGLTFTRKAAGELASRIRERIAQLAQRGLLPGDYDDFEAPLVATYNSFANTIYRDHAMLLGRESDGEVLGAASAWQLARSIVVGSGDPRLPDLARNVDQVTKAVLSLSHSLSENIADPEQVRAMAKRFAGLAELPAGGRGAYGEAVRIAGTVASLDVLLDLADQFSVAKARRGVVEYSDQVALALDIVRRVPTVASGIRERYRVVLLDEYQDTSVVQTWLLAALFAGQSVMAVGDPNQSIYGWRGASSANLEQFGLQFRVQSGVQSGVQGGEAPGAGEPLGANGSTRSNASARSDFSTRFNLSTSWRNGHDILAIANALVGPLRPETRVPVEKLQPGPVASRFAVDVGYHETVRDEAAAAAAWLAERLAEGVAATGTPPTAAMLFRTRSTQSWFIAALREASIPFHVLGVGGLMAEPEIADLVSALRVVHDPSAGSELIRLLAGSRWRIGVRDLRALSRVASWLRDRDYGQHPYEDAVKERLRASVVDGEGGSIIDALDFVATARPGHSQLEGFSADGLDRLRHAGGTFTRLRARGGLDLLDYVTLVVQELQLDIEVAANDHRTLGGANLEALFDALNGYLAVDDSASLGGFLSWLKEAEWRDGLAPRPEDAEPGTVQLLTVHGSKGLEWDLVVVPRWVEDELPGKPLEGSGGWLTFGALPWAFRGDAAELPEFSWEEAETRKEVVDAKAEFVEKVQHHHVMEERRLGYVAVTRARHRLLLSGSYWATQTSPRRPSAFLRELQAGGLVGELPEIEESESNPLGDEVTTLSWPLDPLGGRRSTIEAAAEAVGAADPAHSGPWRETLDLLLAERANRLGAAASMAPPTRIPASRFKDFVTDPAAVRATLRRPMPERPYRATRLGTLFHDWVEARYGVSGTAEELDSLGDLGGEPEDDRGAIDMGELARLQQVFGRSRWATRTPVEVEREIHLILDGQIIVCKIDAIYFDGDRYEVVDWKTGKAPKNAQDLEDKQLQLALYRLAFARWKNIDPESIDAVFFYVSDDTIIRPARIFAESELVALWRASL